MPNLLQPSLTGGELAPGLRARVDLALYQTALATLRNFIVKRTGGIETRPGLLLGGRTSRQAARTRFERFVFSRDQTYLIEFGEGKAWVWTADGRRVTFGDPAPTFADATTATENPVAAVSAQPTYFEIQTHIPLSFLNWQVGDVVQIRGITGTGEIEWCNGEHELIAVGVNTFRIARHSSGPAAWTPSANGRVALCVAVDTPYSAEEVFDLRVTQSADVMTIAHRGHALREIRRVGPKAFSVATPVFETGPFKLENKDESILIHASHTQGNVTLTATASIFTASRIGSLLRLDAENISTLPWSPIESAVAIGASRRHQGNVYIAVGGAGGNNGTVPPTHTQGRQSDGSASVNRIWEYLHSGYGVVRILTAAGTTATAQVLSRLPIDVVGGATTDAGPWAMTGDGTTATLTIAGTSTRPFDYEVTYDGIIQRRANYRLNSTTQIAFVTAPATGVAVSVRELSQNRRTSLWSMGAWSPEEGWPGCVTYYANRQVTASTRAEPARVDASRTDDYLDFKESNPAQEDDPIDLRLGGRNNASIADLVPLTRLVALTESGPYRIKGGGDDTFTPANAGQKEVDNIGAANLPGVVAEKSALYVQAGQTRIRELRFVDVEDVENRELSLRAEHYFTPANRVTGLDYAALPSNLVLAPREDGAVGVLTHLPEQEVQGWSLLVTDGVVEQVCVAPNGAVDEVLMLVRRTLHGQTVRYLERLANRHPADARDIVCVDSGLTYDGRQAGSAVLTGSTWTAGSVLTLTADSMVLDASLIGRQVWLYAGTAVARATIEGVTSATVASVQADEMIPAALRAQPGHWAITATTFRGLMHLAGKTVAIQADRAVAPSQVVDSTGQVTLAEPGAVVHVGLPFACRARTLAINILNRETVRWREKTIPEVALLVTEALAAEVGLDEDNLEVIPGRDVLDDYEVPAGVDGLLEVQVQNTWQDTGQFEVWQRDPAPLTVLGLIPRVVLGK